MRSTRARPGGPFVVQAGVLPPSMENGNYILQRASGHSV